MTTGIDYMARMQIVVQGVNTVMKKRIWNKVKDIMIELLMILGIFCSCFIVATIACEIISIGISQEVGWLANMCIAVLLTSIMIYKIFRKE